MTREERHYHFYRFVSPVWFVHSRGVVRSGRLVRLPSPGHARLRPYFTRPGFPQHRCMFRYLLSGAASPIPAYPASTYGPGSTPVTDTAVDAGKERSMPWQSIQPLIGLWIGLLLLVGCGGGAVCAGAPPPAAYPPPHPPAPARGQA